MLPVAVMIGTDVSKADIPAFKMVFDQPEVFPIRILQNCDGAH